MRALLVPSPDSLVGLRDGEAGLGLSYSIQLGLVAAQ